MQIFCLTFLKPLNQSNPNDIITKDSSSATEDAVGLLSLKRNPLKTVGPGGKLPIQPIIFPTKCSRGVTSMSYWLQGLCFQRGTSLWGLISHTYHSVVSAPLSAVTEEPSRNERHVVLSDRVGVLGEIKNITQSEVAAPAV